MFTRDHLSLSLSQMNPVRNIVLNCCRFHFFFILLSAHHHPSDIFPSGFPTKTLYAFRFSSMNVACPIHFVILLRITTVQIINFVMQFFPSSTHDFSLM